MKIFPLAIGVAIASAATSAFAADFVVAAPAPVPPPVVVFNPLAPVVAVVALPFKVAGAIVTSLAPPPPPPPVPVVAKF